jgi:hypothetical protein
MQALVAYLATGTSIAMNPLTFTSTPHARRRLRSMAGLGLLCVGTSAGAQGAPERAQDKGFVEDHENAVVMRFQGVVAVPFETAYRNILRQAHSCWVPAVLRGSPDADRVLENELNRAAGEAMIVVSDPTMGPGVAFVSVRLRTDGARTHINAAAMKSTPGAPHLGSAEIRLLDKWAVGELTACSTPR